MDPSLFLFSSLSPSSFIVSWIILVKIISIRPPSSSIKIPIITPFLDLDPYWNRWRASKKIGSFSYSPSNSSVRGPFESWCLLSSISLPFSLNSARFQGVEPCVTRSLFVRGRCSIPSRNSLSRIFLLLLLFKKYDEFRFTSFETSIPLRDWFRKGIWFVNLIKISL